MNNNKLIISSFGPFYEALNSYSTVLLRGVLGFILILHGYPKIVLVFSGGVLESLVKDIETLGFPFPYVWSIIIAGVEFFGGILIVLGLFTRPVVLAIFIEMLVLFTLYFPLFTGQSRYVLVLLVISLVVFIKGGGRFSMDAKIGKEF